MRITKKELDRLIREEVSTQLKEGVKNVKFTAFISPETHPDGIEVFVDAIVRTSDRDEEQLGPDVEIVRVADANSNRELPYEEYESAYSELGDLAYEEIGIYEPSLEEAMMLDLGRFASFLNEEEELAVSAPKPVLNTPRLPAEHETVCWACDGQGILQDDHGEDFACEECEGTGVLSNGEPEDDNQICGTCSGSGEGMYDGSVCMNCKGSGTEPPQRSDDDDYDWLD